MASPALEPNHGIWQGRRSREPVSPGPWGVTSDPRGSRAPRGRRGGAGVELQQVCPNPPETQRQQEGARAVGMTTVGPPRPPRAGASLTAARDLPRRRRRETADRRRASGRAEGRRRPPAALVRGASRGEDAPLPPRSAVSGRLRGRVSLRGAVSLVLGGGGVTTAQMRGSFPVGPHARPRRGSRALSSPRIEGFRLDAWRRRPSGSGRAIGATRCAWCHLRARASVYGQGHVRMRM